MTRDAIQIAILVIFCWAISFAAYVATATDMQGPVF